MKALIQLLAMFVLLIAVFQLMVSVEPESNEIAQLQREYGTKEVCMIYVDMESKIIMDEGSIGVGSPSVKLITSEDVYSCGTKKKL